MASKLNVSRLKSDRGLISIENTGVVNLSESSSHFAIPSGGEATEGTPSSQALRFNTDTNQLNIFDGSQWNRIIDASDPLASTKTTIVRDGLVVYLDASNPASYPGTGNDWFDLSGSENHYEITGSAPVTWGSEGYFDVGLGGAAFLGPPSSQIGFLAGENEHTIMAVTYWTTPSNSQFFWFVANTGGNNRAIASHMPWGDQNTYYDVSGCCSATQRIAGNVSNFRDNLGLITYRTRVTEKPERQVFRNLTAFLNSGNNATDNVIAWSDNGRAILCANWQGRIYAFLAYNKALTDTEIQQNYNSLRGKFNF